MGAVAEWVRQAARDWEDSEEGGGGGGGCGVESTLQPEMIYLLAPFS